MSHRSWIISLPVACLTLAACGDGRTPLLVYSPHGREILQPVEERFEELNPDIDLRWLDMGSQEVLDRIRSEAANPQADIWYGGPHTIFEQGVEADLLQPYRPAWADHLPAQAVQADDLYFAIYRATPVLVYNSDLVERDEAPDAWDDLLDPQWQGKVVLREPPASGTMRTLFGMVLSDSVRDTGDVEQGFEWLRALDRQTKEYVPNPTLLFEKLARGEGVVSMWEITDILALAEKGVPLAYKLSESGTPFILDAVGVVNGAPHPEAARRFLDWVGTDETLLLVLDRGYRLPARTDLPLDEMPAWAREALTATEPADIDWNLVIEHSNEWMARWDREVRGRG